MNLSVQLLDSKNEAAYEAFVLSHNAGLFYYSIKYKRLLETFLTSVESKYFICYDASEVVGVFPIFKKYSEYGHVLNSLPFYGSHGAPLIHQAYPVEKQAMIRFELINAFEELQKSDDIISSTIIINPLDLGDDINGLIAYRHSLYDTRIAQVTYFPEYTGSSETLASVIMDKFHSKTRNMVRKALGTGAQFSHSNSLPVTDFLISQHRRGIEAMDGIAKPRYVFHAINNIFEYDKDYRIYVTYFDEKIIAALLLFYYNHVVEYYTPVVRPEYRPLQPLTLLIWQAMFDAIKQGYTLWNWGGTWRTQDSLYRFKTRFGAVDIPYEYHTFEKNKSFRKFSKADLLAEYPYFYVLPFSALENH